MRIAKRQGNRVRIGNGERAVAGRPIAARRRAVRTWRGRRLAWLAVLILWGTMRVPAQEIVRDRGDSRTAWSAFANRWREAVDAYERKDFERARNLFEKMVEGAGSSAHPDLYFNLGNAYYESGEKGKAAWTYEKALALAPRHRDARRNLGLVRADLPAPKSAALFLFKPAAWIYSRVSLGEWTFLFESAYFCAALFGSLWILLGAGPWRRIARLGCVGGLLLAVGTAAFLIPRYIETEWKRYAVVLKSGAIVRSAPGRDDAESEYFEALEGERLEVTEASMAGWYRVKHPADGRVGYLPESALGEI